MDRVLEHVIHEVRIWLDEVVKGRENLEVLSLLFVEEVEAHLVLVELHLGNRLFEFISLVLNHLLSFLDFLFLFLELLDLFVDLLFHHLKQVLMLDFKLVHDASEALF